VPSWQVAHCLADRLLLPKVRAFVDFLQQHWMRQRPPL
jgi:hypothetical protein